MNIYLLHINKLQQQPLVRSHSSCKQPRICVLIDAVFSRSRWEHLLCFFLCFVKIKEITLKHLNCSSFDQASMCAEARRQVMHMLTAVLLIRREFKVARW